MTMETKKEEVEEMEVSGEVVEETPEEEDKKVAEENVNVVEEEKEVVLEEAPLEAPQTDVLQMAHAVLRAWKKLYQVEQPKAEDCHYYAEELWCEDKNFWDHGKHKVSRGDWTVQQFDKELQNLKKKQEPVWDKLI